MKQTPTPYKAPTYRELHQLKHQVLALQQQCKGMLTVIDKVLVNLPVQNYSPDLTETDK